MNLEYVALCLLIFVFLVIFYGVIIIHDIPYVIAKKRNHPHADAIHIAGWVSLFTLHVLWPLIWIWAALYRPERGWGMQSDKLIETSISDINLLNARVEELEEKLHRLQSSDSSSRT